MKIAIMQPTYLPWIGYFDLMDRVDVFVYLDDVSFSKKSWQQRNRIKSAQNQMWLTVPVLSKGKSGQLIKDVEINEKVKWRKDHYFSLQQNYSKAEYCPLYIKLFEEMYEAHLDRLVELNIGFIEKFKQALNIHCSTRRATEILGGRADDDAIEHLIRIGRALGATQYISPEGSRDYLGEGEAFCAAGIGFEYHHYEHPVYRQLFGDFISHLSIADLLFNEGPDSLKRIRSTRSDSIYERKIGEI